MSEKRSGGFAKSFFGGLLGTVVALLAAVGVFAAINGGLTGLSSLVKSGDIPVVPASTSTDSTSEGSRDGYAQSRTDEPNATEPTAGADSTNTQGTTTIVLSQDTTALAEVVAEKCLPSVVAIDIYTYQAGPGYGSRSGDYYGYLFGEEGSSDSQLELYSLGSGVVLTADGYVLTNYHVIEDGSAFQVLMPNGKKVSAMLTGADSALDLAVLQVQEQADTLVPVSIGSSEGLKVGSTVIAIGNPGGEILANTVTQGIVSALQRSSVSSNNTTRNVNYIQHDAAINSGNSGGGLFDYQGNLVGINTLKYAGSSDSTSYEGLGFAIPVETAYPIAQQLISNGKVIRPQMGVTVSEQEGPDEPMNDYAPAGVVIMGVNANTPADRAGLRQYDFVTAVNGQRVTTVRELTTILDTFQAGDTVTLTVVRYNNAGMVNNSNNYNNYYGNFPFGFGFGYGYGDYGYGYGDGSNGGNSNGSSRGTLTVGGGYQTLQIEVTLEVLE